MQPEQITMLVKLNGRILFRVGAGRKASSSWALREMDADGPEEIETVLHPTVPTSKTSSKPKPQRIWLCGFGSQSADCAERWQA